MKILVVEDEPGPREGMCRLLRAASPDWEVLEPTANGLDGVRVAREQRPDLVITDIRMPELDGLAMIAQLRQVDPDLAVVVLSGFSDFDYARRCLSLGVKEYLVKPVTAPVLIGVVRSVEEAHGADADVVEVLEGRGALPGSGVLFLFRTDVTAGPSRRTVLRRELAGLTGNPQGTLIAEILRHREVFFWVREVQDLPKAATARFLDSLAHRLHGSVIGGAQTTDGTAIREAAARLRRRLKRFLVDPPPGLLWGDEGDPTVPVPYPLGLEKEGLLALPAPREAGLSLVLERLRTEAFREGFDPLSAVRVVSRFFFALQNRLKDLDPGRFGAFQLLDPVALLDQALNVREAAEVFRRVAEVLAAETSAPTPVSDNLKIQAALTMITQRLSNPPTLAECAEELGMSGEYLSRLFKAQMGTGYAKYVMGQRIELAKTSLADVHQTVQRISISLGFGNTKYFSAVFRKETGFTPSEYRSRFQ